MAAYKSKGVGRGQGKNAPGIREEVDSTKPLAATLMQEFQNLKDKFKNEDEEYDKGLSLSLQLHLSHVYIL